MDGIQARIARYDSRIENARNSWKAANAEQYQGTETCPTCGQQIPEEQAAAARAAWEAQKKLRLESYVKEADELKAGKVQEEREMQEISGNL